MAAPPSAAAASVAPPAAPASSAVEPARPEAIAIASSSRSDASATIIRLQKAAASPRKRKEKEDSSDEEEEAAAEKEDDDDDDDDDDEYDDDDDDFASSGTAAAPPRPTAAAAPAHTKQAFKRRATKSPEAALAKVRAENAAKQRKIAELNRKVTALESTIVGLRGENISRESALLEARRARDMEKDLRVNAEKAAREGAQRDGEMLTASVYLLTQAREDVHDLEHKLTRANIRIQELHTKAFDHLCVICADKNGIFKIHAAAKDVTHWLCESCGPAFAKSIALDVSEPRCPACRCELPTPLPLLVTDSADLLERWQENFSRQHVTSLATLAYAGRIQRAVVAVDDQLRSFRRVRPTDTVPRMQPEFEQHRRRIARSVLLKSLPILNNNEANANRLLDGLSLRPDVPDDESDDVIVG